MTTLMADKRRVAVAALAATLLGVGALFFAGRADATSYPCNDEPWGVGSGRDFWATAGSGPNSVFVGADPNTNDAGDGYYGGFVCAGAPNGEASQAAVALSVHDPSGNPTPGATVEGVQCNTPLPDEPGWQPGCGWLVRTTGAEVGTPTTGTNAPGGSTMGSGGSVGTGTGTCVYVNSTTPLSCPAGITVAGVTVNEADLVPSVTPYTPTPPCTGINNTCVPVGATVRIFNDTSNPTLNVTTPSGSQPVDVAPTGLCVQVNATC